MIPLKKVVQSVSRRELLEIIRAALDCQPHHDGIIKIDPKVPKGQRMLPGDKAQIICFQCVERMRNALGLEIDEPVPSHLQYFFRQKSKRKK